MDHVTGDLVVTRPMVYQLAIGNVGTTNKPNAVDGSLDAIVLALIVERIPGLIFSIELIKGIYRHGSLVSTVR